MSYGAALDVEEVGVKVENLKLAVMQDTLDFKGLNEALVLSKELQKQLKQCIFDNQKAITKINALIKKFNLTEKEVDGLSFQALKKIQFIFF